MAKKQPGDPIGYSAADWNSFVDAADDYRRRREGGEGRGGLTGTYEPRGTILHVKNTSGGAAARFDALGIDGVQITPTANLAQFQDTPVLKGITPAAGAHAGKWVLCLEPIANNAVGRALLSGVTPAIVDIDDTSHKFADIVDSSTRLTSKTSGAAQILYQEAGTGDKHCVIRIGGGGAAGPLRIGVLQNPLGNNQIGDLDLYEQTGTNAPSIKSPLQTIEVMNITGIELQAGPLMYAEVIDDFEQDIVFPAQINECFLPDLTVTTAF